MKCFSSRNPLKSSTGDPMPTGRCLNCHQVFRRRPQNKEQCYCSQKTCQRARKRNWELQKLASDPDYQENRKASQMAWQESHRDYWKAYRQKYPAQAERNRELQLIRNAKQRGHFVEQILMKAPQISPLRLNSFSLSSVPIAKTDASIPYQLCLITCCEEDLIAKTDASNPVSAQIFRVFVQLPVIAKTDV